MKTGKRYDTESMGLVIAISVHSFIYSANVHCVPFLGCWCCRPPWTSGAVPTLATVMLWTGGDLSMRPCQGSLWPELSGTCVDSLCGRRRLCLGIPQQQEKNVLSFFPGSTWVWWVLLSLEGFRQ